MAVVLSGVRVDFATFSKIYNSVWEVRGPAVWAEGSWNGSRVAQWYNLSGESAELLRGDGTPIGVLLDRLEETPAECECPSEVWPAVVAALRQHWPLYSMVCRWPHP